jgi:prepilin-type N-terminal cleavage/methylation domain-containing protein
MLTSMQSGGKAKRRGFTIVELMMVVTLVALTAAWALPKFSLARYRADGAGRLARMLLQVAQRNAITRQSNVIVSFDATNNRLRVVQDYNNNDTLNTTDLVTFRKLEEGVKFIRPTWAGVSGGVPAAAVNGSALRTVSSYPSVIFRRDGSASTDLEIYFTARDAVREEYRAVVVTASTGKCDLFKWNGATWIRMNQ